MNRHNPQCYDGGNTVAFRGTVDLALHLYKKMQAFFVDGLGGAGKTFLYGCLLSSVRAAGGIALAVASSGIALCC